MARALLSVGGLEGTSGVQDSRPQTHSITGARGAALLSYCFCCVCGSACWCKLAAAAYDTDSPACAVVRSSARTRDGLSASYSPAHEHANTRTHACKHALTFLV
eukprot:6190123-Pleurochrysis_carterae.AAC.1